MESASEFHCLIKSRLDLYDELEKAIRKVHPYDVPEIIVLPVMSGGGDYLKGLAEELR